VQLGVVATHRAAGPQLIGIVSAAARRGWTCRCFLTDEGVLLLRMPEVVELARGGTMRLDVCHLSWERFGAGDVPEGARAGSQYNNAELAHACDRVVVL
jgi:hypothetical protein